jgi:colanic acid/amylovoran biosynthesis glycosyltransferase
VRVAIVVRAFPLVSETFVVNHAVGLQARGHDVVIVPERPHAVAETTPASSRSLDVTVIREPAVPRSALRRIADTPMQVIASMTDRGGPALRVARSTQIAGGPGARALVKRHYWARRMAAVGTVDLVHSHFGPCAVFAWTARQRGLIDAPIVATVHGSDVTRLPLLLGADIYRNAFEGIDAITVGSRFIASVVNGLGAPPERTHVVPQGIDVDTFVPAPHKRTAQQGPTAITVGRLVPCKGVDIALRAIAAAAHEVPDLKYVVIGDGPERSRLESLAGELGIRTRVTFCGSADRHVVVEKLQTADIYLQPSVQTGDGRAEGQGLAPLEAMATALPVIVSNVGGLAEAVHDGGTGFVVPDSDVATMAERIVDLARDAQGRVGMGSRGREHVVANYSLTAQLDRLESLYAGIVQRKLGERIAQ